jgi:pyruvate carboxylase subunit B
MVGKILKTLKSVGDAVEEDEIVVVMEALKMEIPVVAPVSGRIASLKVSAGQAVDADEILAEIE